MTSEIIREIIDDLKKTKSLIDSEKCDLIVYLRDLYYKEAEPFENEIDELIDKWA